jgi:hypothetical protein
MGAVRLAITDVDWAVRELIDAEVRYEEAKDVWEMCKEQLLAIDVQNSVFRDFCERLLTLRKHTTII